MGRFHRFRGSHRVFRLGIPARRSTLSHPLLAERAHITAGAAVALAAPETRLAALGELEILEAWPAWKLGQPEAEACARQVANAMGGLHADGGIDGPAAEQDPQV